MSKLKPQEQGQNQHQTGGQSANAGKSRRSGGQGTDSGQNQSTSGEQEKGNPRQGSERGFKRCRQNVTDKPAVDFVNY